MSPLSRALARFAQVATVRLGKATAIARAITSMPGSTTVAYFSMEICLEQGIPTYSGGLGVLSGDTLRSAADLGAPVVGITLLHRQGYFEQHIDAQGNQTESPVHWNPEALLEPVDARASVLIEGRHVQI